MATCRLLVRLADLSSCSLLDAPGNAPPAAAGLARKVVTAVVLPLASLALAVVLTAFFSTKAGRSLAAAALRALACSAAAALAQLPAAVAEAGAALASAARAAARAAVHAAARAAARSVGPLLYAVRRFALRLLLVLSFTMRGVAAASWRLMSPRQRLLLVCGAAAVAAAALLVLRAQALAVRAGMFLFRHAAFYIAILLAKSALLWRLRAAIWGPAKQRLRPRGATAASASAAGGQAGERGGPAAAGGDGACDSRARGKSPAPASPGDQPAAALQMSRLPRGAEAGGGTCCAADGKGSAVAEAPDETMK